jgi:ABC-2 type transport system permease protein
VIDNDVKVLGGVDYRTRQPRLPWSIVDELRKQYEVLEVPPGRVADEKLDGLLAVIPSTLSQSEMDLVLKTIRNGTPTLLLVDPLPLVNMEWAPAAPIAAQIDPYRSGDSAVQRNFGDIRKMLVELGVNWVPARIVWDSSNPHPDMSHLPPEAVFVGPGNGNAQALNASHPVTTGLQELLMMYPGYLLEADAQTFSFEPLLQTGRLSGTIGFFQATRPTPSGPELTSGVTHEPDERQYVLAAHVRSKAGDSPAAKPSNVIVIADLDFISDYFFDIRASAPVNANFDNISLFLNAIDVLVGDESFIALRQRRARYRTLERIEAQTRQFMEQRTQEEQLAEREARTALEEARNRVKDRVEEIRTRQDLDEQARQILVRNLDVAETRRLQVLEANINSQKEAKIQASRETMERQLRRIRGFIRAMAVLLPPIPILLLGIAIFARQRRREREGARVVRRLREQP